MKPKEQSKKKQLTIAGIVAGVLLIPISFWVWHTFHNDAIDYGEPINKALANGGATKICGGGTPVLGPDDFTPIYGVTYETSLNYDQTVALVTKVAKDNGFNLKQAKPGSLPVPDIYISNWYYDHSTVMSNRPWADSGPVELTFMLGNASDPDKPFTLYKPSCKKDEDVLVKNDKDHTAIRLEIKLPRNRW